MSVLFNDSSELRSGWKFATYLLIFGLLLFAAGALISAVLDPSVAEGEVGLLSVNAFGLLIPAVGALLFMVRFVDRIPVSTYGVSMHEKWGRDLVLGLLIAAAMLLLFDLVGALFERLSVETAPHGDGFWLNFLLILVMLGISAANEELVFRGYPLQVLMAGIGAWPAMILLSGLFGLLHHLNPGATWLGTTNTFLAGMLLSVAYLRTRSLWFPFGIHVGWNVAIGPVSGYAVSGIQISSIWTTEMSGADWFTGGGYGPEGGALGTLVMMIAICAVLLTRRVEISPTLRTLLLNHSTKVYAKDIVGSEREASEPSQF